MFGSGLVTKARIERFPKDEEVPILLRVPVVGLPPLEEKTIEQP